ncbi:MAG: transporter [Rikenellaceae bacterium]
MRYKIEILSLLALLMGVGSAVAQNTNSSYGGVVLNNDIMLSSDFATLSNRGVSGTARSMAMGGAFTSLGGDIASMSINPAGLGMYRSDHFSVTPMVSISSASTPSTDDWQGNNSSNFALGNIGIVLNIYQGSTKSGKPVSISIGLGVNRVADYNQKYSYSSLSEYNSSASGELMPTIADVFAQQLGGAGVYPSSNGSLGYTSTDPYLWPAILGYNGYMVSDYSDSSGKYWTPDTIGANASIAHGLMVESSGSINEYLISMGANISNVIYIGATLGVESVRMDRTITYQEEYLYIDAPASSSGEQLSSYLDYATISQRSYIKGVGVNFKIGAIIRPFEALRIGIAYHTPTAYSLERVYQGDIQSKISNSTASEYNSDSTGQLYDEGSNSWEFSSPSRLLLGASLTLGSRMVVSADYECAWYNSISVNNIPTGTGFVLSDYDKEFSTSYKPTNTLRAGVEIKPLDNIALRVGGGYTTSMLEDDSAFYSSMTPTTSYYVGGGVGLYLGANTTLDFTYQNHKQNYSSYQLFYSEVSGGELSSGSFETSIRNHNIVATLGFKF